MREPVMARNNEIAAAVRARLREAGVPAFNFVSSPGSGKTLLLERTLAELGSELRLAVVTGDVQTQNDAERLARHTNHLVQAVVTNGACHLDSRQVETALAAIDLDETDLLFIENVGNLVCPASWDLGEEAKVVLFSVTEGEDKPLKYPPMFHSAGAVIVTKTELAAAAGFDRGQALANLKRISHHAHIFELSAKTGEGMKEWIEFLVRQHAAVRAKEVRAIPATPPVSKRE
ncbi:MAG TPA: hydrogenase nickel incorporation protein HypB [Gemmatimonadales bacterium]|nr:hydrogenase nickel incorporation protein HypB [Gemmatimonadales bacterium]